MRDVEDLGAVARGIIDDNRYMALGTADETGRPWVSPVGVPPRGSDNEFHLIAREAANHAIGRTRNG